jgi:DNA modification methylase
MNLINGDCLEKMKDIPDKSVDFVFLDLPYGQTACKWDVKIDLDALWKQLKRIAKNDRTPFFFSTTTKFGFELIKANEKWFRWDLVWKKNRAAGFLNAYKLPMRKHEMVYCFAKKSPEYDVSSHKEYVEEKKTRGESEMKVDLYHNNNVGVKSKTHKDPLPTSDITPPTTEHELVYCFAKKSPEYDVSSHKEYTEQKEYGHSSEGNGKTKESNRCKAKTHKDPLPTSDITPKGTLEYETYGRTSGNPLIRTQTKHEDRLPTSDITQPTFDLDEAPSSWCEFKNDEKTGHRTAKPVALMEFLLKYWTKPDATVLDPTMGSGSMGIACKKMGRKFIGIEMDEDIYKLAQERIKNI